MAREIPIHLRANAEGRVQTGDTSDLVHVLFVFLYLRSERLLVDALVDVTLPDRPLSGPEGDAHINEVEGRW
jgi:hypothetical protein